MTDPSDRSTSTARDGIGGRPRPPRRLVAGLVAAVPVAVLAVVALAGQGDDPEPARHDRGAADTPAETRDTADAGRTAAGTDTAGGGAAEGGSGGESAAAVPEVPSAPAAAGAEGDRTVATYPQPTVPEGGCTQTDGTAVVELDDVPSPACVRLAGDQALVFRNRTGREISLVAEGLNEVVPAGADMKIGRVADAFPQGRSTFWSPGNPDLSGLVEVS